MAICAAWALLFAFGTVRMLLQREWGYAIVTAAFLMIFGLRIVQSLRRLKTTDADDPVAEYRRQQGGSPKPLE